MDGWMNGRTDGWMAGWLASQSVDRSIGRSFGRLVGWLLFDETMGADRMIYVHNISLKRIIREMGHYSYLSKWIVKSASSVSNYHIFDEIGALLGHLYVYIIYMQYMYTTSNIYILYIYLCITYIFVHTREI